MPTTRSGAKYLMTSAVKHTWNGFAVSRSSHKLIEHLRATLHEPITDG
jgi:hypothetical protein